jgi:hypothetical protein
MLLNLLFDSSTSVEKRIITPGVLRFAFTHAASTMICLVGWAGFYPTSRCPHR